MKSLCFFIFIVVVYSQTNDTNWKLVGTTNLPFLPWATSTEGLASDDQSFYYNSRDFITRTTYNYTVIDPHNFLAIPSSLHLESYNHLGDGDIYNGLLYQGLEKPDYTECALLTYNVTTLKWTGNYKKTNQLHMPWVAVNNDLIYSSDWSPIDRLYVYDLQFNFQYYVQLDTTIYEPQGGEFYKDLLYISCNGGYVYVFDVSTSNIGVLHSYFYTGITEEMEGLTFVDLRFLGQGILHILDGESILPISSNLNHMLYHYDYL